jgi:hypothetical protein
MVVKMIFIELPNPGCDSCFRDPCCFGGQKLLAGHLRPALGAYLIQAALTGDVRLFVPALGANAAAAGARAGFIAAATTTAVALATACTTPQASALSCPASSAQHSSEHFYLHI